MAHSDLIDSLIATYRTLNMTVRPLSNEQALKPGSSGESIRDLVAGLRERELVTSQMLKNMTMGDLGTAGAHGGELEILEPINEQNVRVLLSEFGTAREAILALVRDMPDEALDTERTGGIGFTTIRSVVEDLVQRDQTFMRQLEGLVPART